MTCLIATWPLANNEVPDINQTRLSVIPAYAFTMTRDFTYEWKDLIRWIYGGEHALQKLIYDFALEIGHKYGSNHSKIHLKMSVNMKFLKAPRNRKYVSWQFT